MIRILKISVTLCLLAGIANAKMMTIDARMAATDNGRSTMHVRVAYHNIAGPFSARLVYEMYNSGDLNNSRIGVQGVYENIFSEDSKFSMVPFAGASMVSSDDGSGTSVDAGFDARYSALSWLAPIFGLEVLGFSDTHLLDYYAGASFLIKEWVNFDATYSIVSMGASQAPAIAFRLKFMF